MNYGLFLKQLRLSNKKTQKEVALHLNMPLSTLSDYERGRTIPSLERFAALVSYYGISLESSIVGKEVIDITKYSKVGKQKAYALQNEEMQKLNNSSAKKHNL